MPEKNQTEQNIEYRIAEIKKISHFEKDFTEFGLTEEDIKTGGMGMRLNFGIDAEKGILSYNIKASFIKKIKNKDLDLFGLESIYKFQIKDFDKFIKGKKTNEYSIPDPIMMNFINISISGTRGMLVALNTNPSYKNIYIPLIDPSWILKSLKKKLEK